MRRADDWPSKVGDKERLRALSAETGDVVAGRKLPCRRFVGDDLIMSCLTAALLVPDVVRWRQVEKRYIGRIAEANRCSP